MIDQLVEAGRWAPSASNRQPWHFIVVRDEAIRKAIAEEATYHFIGWQHVAQAPLLIALCGEVGNPLYRRFVHQDIGLAGCHIMLQAHALGLGTCWTGGIDPGALGAILRLPDSLEVIGLLSAGFPAEDPEPRQRKAAEEVAHFDLFGQRDDQQPTKPGAVAGGFAGRLRRLVRTNLRPPR
jgi:nitroreductase